MAARDDAPATKAGYMKDYLAALRRLSPAQSERVLEGLRELVDEIDQASRSAWLPIRANLRVTDAVFSKLGSKDAAEFYAQWIKQQTGTPVWSNLVRTGLALFGQNPGSLAKWVPKSFDLMYRGYGRWSVERVSDTEARLTLDDMPVELATNIHWQQSVRSGLFALYALSGTDGEIILESASSVHRTMLITLRWTR